MTDPPRASEAAPSDERCRVVLAGDSVVVAEFAFRIDPVVNATVVAVARALRQMPPRGVRDIVPTFGTVAVHFDPLVIDAQTVTAWLGTTARLTRRVEESTGVRLRIPVRYGGSDGPDLSVVARFAGLTEDEVVRLHAGRLYRVYMLGFLPGFAYMGTVDPRIAAPRRTSPRTAVPAGSVGIAGEQTGIYPSVAPGGWHIIGRTSTATFDPTRESPCLLQPGDVVQFEPATDGIG